MRKVFFFFVLLFFCACDIDNSIDWDPSFDALSKHPYGMYILEKELQRSNDGFEIITQSTPSFFEELLAYAPVDGFSQTGRTYMFIYPEVFHDSSVWEQYEDFAESGGHVFLAKHAFEETFLDYAEVDLVRNTSKNSVRLYTEKSHYKTQNFRYEKGEFGSYFTGAENRPDIDVLGYIEIDGKKHPNFIRLKFGEGFFYLHASPYAFTNYHMLETDHYKYVVNCLSYLPQSKLYWDNNNVIRKSRIDESQEDGGFFSSLGFIFAHKALRIGFILLVFLGIFALMFNYKRRKPVQESWRAPSNKYLQFVQTLSHLYRNEDDHSELIATQANYIIHQLSKKYNLNPNQLDANFADQLFVQTQVNAEVCKNMTLKLQAARTRKLKTHTEFIRFNEQVDTFLQKIP